MQERPADRLVPDRLTWTARDHPSFDSLAITLIHSSAKHRTGSTELAVSEFPPVPFDIIASLGQVRASPLLLLLLLL